MADLSSADIDKIASILGEQQARQRESVRHDFPAKEEFNRRIARCKADIATHSEEYNSILAEIAAEKAKLPALLEKVKEAESVQVAQRAVIQRLQNKADRARKLVATSAQDKAEYEARLANNDHLKFKSAVR